MKPSRFTVDAGRILEVKIVVNDQGSDASDDDMEVAYDTMAFPSRLIVP